jgi:hypothetical protein
MKLFYNLTTFNKANKNIFPKKLKLEEEEKKSLISNKRTIN